MSQDYHHPGVFSFSNGFERSQAEQLQQHHIVQQIRNDKLRVQGAFEPQPQLVAAAIQEEEQPVGLPSNEASGMLSEMFNFPPGTARGLLENQISHGYHHHHHAQQPQHHQISSINAAAAMQLFLMNPQPQPRSPSPSSSSHPPAATSSTLHMLLPNPSPTSTLQGFHTPTGGGPFSQFTWAANEGGTNNAAAGEGQGLSLSLSSSLQHLDAAKAGEEFRISGDGTGMLFFSQGMGSTSSEFPCKNNLNLSGGGVMDQSHQIHVGFGSSFGVINGLRNSKYAKAAQELLEEFCSVVRGHHQFNKNKTGRLNIAIQNPNSNHTSSDGDAANNNNNSSSSSKDIPPLSAADRIEQQRRKVKLLSMLDEVDRRYNRYCEQMQMVVNSFDLVMGFEAAVPYTALAQKAMSRHFRCLKDAVAAQLKHSCELLGEKDAGMSGLTKGETPRLKLLEQSLRQQRAFHQMGMTEQEAWRPQRGLPERSVNALRAWLFEHFLHPYPSDADKHMLARQAGLSRSQVSNWFINARVRLWKPMVEEMYQQEVKEEAGDSEKIHSPHSGDTVAQTPTPNAFSNSAPPNTITNSTTPPAAAAATTVAATDDPVAAITIAATGKRSEINAPESDPSIRTINTQCFSENQAKSSSSTPILPTATPFNANIALPAAQSFPTLHSSNTCHRRGMAGSDDFGTVDSSKADIGSTLVSFGTNAAGNVSLTLGLRHAGNIPDKNHFFG